ncbi:F-box domain containing protein [Tanacetum coccineum]
MSSDYIPFEIQSEIMKRLPVKSLVQFRSVSKQWKSFIDCPEFIKTYHINHPNPKHHLLCTVGYTRIGFGVCPHTNDPKLVKINVVETPGVCWEVQSTRGSFILLFDLKSDTFGEVSIPERFVRIYGIWVAKVNGSLGLLEYNKEGEMWVCGVWMRKDDVNNPFTKIYTVKVEGKSVFFRVLGFRNNDEVLLQLDDDDFEKSQIEVYEPSPGRINSVGISGERHTFTAWSYMETLLFLDQSSSIIH